MVAIISNLQQLPPILLSVISFVFAYGFVLLMGTIAGKNGLYVSIVLLIITANLQVLKVTQFSFFRIPVALGTELFAASYLATDILSEIFGKKSARTGVLFGFIGMIFWTIFGIITLGFTPVSLEQVQGDQWLYGIHENFEVIFTQVPAILVASLTAFLFSQLLDIYIFSYLKDKTKGKFLWLRNNVSTILSALVDNTIFSLLAWIILSSHPLPLGEVIKTYILGTYLFRVVAALLDTPIMYFSKKLISPPSEIIFTKSKNS